MQHRVPSNRLACLLIVFKHMHVSPKSSIYLYNPAIPNLQQRREARTEEPVLVSLKQIRMLGRDIRNRLPRHRVRLLINSSVFPKCKILHFLLRVVLFWP